jgi:hypothetical protein
MLWRFFIFYILYFRAVNGFAASSPPPISNKRILRQLYGEWIILHSNHPQFSSLNSRILTIYPRKKIVLGNNKNYGPVACSFEHHGGFRIDCGSEENCSLSEEDSDIICDVVILWKEKKTYVDSIFGIGVNELWKNYYYDPTTSETRVNLNILEANHLYLSDSEHHIHLIRNVQPNKPSGNTPLSTFIMSQIFGSILLNTLHHYFRDIF